MEVLATGFAIDGIIALGILIWLHTRNGKKWLREM